MRIKRICAMCGADYWTGNGKAKYCSDKCRKEATKQRQAKWRIENPDYQKEYRENHPEATERFMESHPDYYRDRSREIRGTVVRKGECVVCGRPFTTTNRKQKTCSTKCGKKMMYARKQHRIPKDRIIDKDITLEALYRRDSGVCYLCGKPCDWNDKNDITVGPMYPSIDHVIPISHGGMHSWENIKLAHFECNWKKSDTLSSDIC